LRGLDGGPAPATLLGTEGCPRPVTPARLLAAGSLMRPAVLLGPASYSGGRSTGVRACCVGYPLAGPAVPNGQGEAAKCSCRVRLPINRRAEFAGGVEGWTRYANPVDSLRPLRAVPEHDEWPLEDRAFLLHSDGVGTRSGGRDGSGRGRCGDRPGYDLEPVQRGSEGVPGSGEPGPRVQAAASGLHRW
jgi:hypothetical protein